MKPRFEPPMHMRTWNTHDWTCPWCREKVHGGEVHDDTARNKFGRKEDTNGRRKV